MSAPTRLDEHDDDLRAYPPAEVRPEPMQWVWRQVAILRSVLGPVYVYACPVCSAAITEPDTKTHRSWHERVVRR